MRADQVSERLVQIPLGDERLAGVLSIPEESNGHSVLIPWGAGAYPSSGRNRLRTRFARHLASEGFHTLRFDYLGVGESTGTYRRGDLRNPFGEDICAAAHWLFEEVPGHLLVVANCFGGWSTLAATGGLPPVEGICVVNSPLGRDHLDIRAEESARQPLMDGLKRVTISKLRDPARRRFYRKAVVSRLRRIAGASAVRTNSLPYLTGLEDLIRQKTRILLLYGNDDFRKDLDQVMNGGLEERLRGTPTVEVVCVDERLRGCSSMGAQNVLFERVAPWLRAVSSHAPFELSS